VMVDGGVVDAAALIFPDRSRSGPEGSLVGSPTVGLDDQLAEQQRRVLEAALQRAGGNRTAAARALGLSFRQMRYRLKKLGID
jgi:two-component system, NtrC family, response regulator PilR